MALNCSTISNKTLIAKKTNLIWLPANLKCLNFSANSGISDINKKEQITIAIKIE